LTAVTPPFRSPPKVVICHILSAAFKPATKLKDNKAEHHKTNIQQSNYFKMDSDLKYLLSLQAVRDQASKVFESAKQGNLKHFDYDEVRMGAVADYVSKVIDVSNTMSTKNAPELVLTTL
jgi:hypothetical protein